MSRSDHRGWSWSSVNGEPDFESRVPTPESRDNHQRYRIAISALLPRLRVRDLAELAASALVVWFVPIPSGRQCTPTRILSGTGMMTYGL